MRGTWSAGCFFAAQCGHYRAWRSGGLGVRGTGAWCWAHFQVPLVRCESTFRALPWERACGGGSSVALRICAREWDVGCWPPAGERLRVTLDLRQRRGRAASPPSRTAVQRDAVQGGKGRAGSATARSLDAPAVEQRDYCSPEEEVQLIQPATRNQRPPSWSVITALAANQSAPSCQCPFLWRTFGAGWQARLIRATAE